MLAVTSAATFRPSSDGKGVVAQLFPNARITSGYRSPSDALSRANPTSYHTKTHAAVDVAPIPGLSFEQFVSRIKAAGHSVIESRDEVKNPSAHATGPHWHVVIGERR